MRSNRLSFGETVQQQWGSPVEGLWLERLALHSAPPARCPPPQTQSAHSSSVPSSTRRIVWAPLSLRGRITIQMVSLRYPAICWPKLLLFRKNLPLLLPVVFFGCAMQSRWWSCGIRLVAWTWVWSVALLGAWCIPANEGKTRTETLLG